MRTDKFLICGMILLGAAAGCSREVAPNDSREETDGVFMLCADQSEEGDVVKTTLGPKSDNKYPVLWKTGDKVSINGIISNAVASSDNGKKSVDFTFGSTPSSPYNVLYPGTSETTKVTFPTTQTYVADSFDGNAAPSYGVATVNNNVATVTLRPLSAVLRIAINGASTITKIVLSSVGGESIAGKFTVNFSTGALTASGDNASSITYNIGEKALGSGDTYFYVTVPARNYSKGFEALVYEQTTEKYMKLILFQNGKDLKGGDIAEFKAVTYNATKVEELVALNDFSAQDGGDPEKKASFTVANYNLLSNYEGARSEKPFFILSNCAEQLGKCVKATGADIICFNEIDATFATSSTQSIQKISEAQGFTGYTWKITNPNKVTHEWTSYDKEYTWANGFAFNASVFEFVDEGTWYWFNKNGGYTGTAETAYSSHLTKYRTLVYAKLRHKTSGKTFNLLVTHLPNYNDNNSDDALEEGVANLYAATAVNQFVSDKDASGNWLLCGDMNAYNGTKGNTGKNKAGYDKLCEVWTDSYEALDAAGNLGDFYKTYNGTQSGANFGYGVLQYTRNHPERRIDHIMYKGGFKAESYKTVRLTYHYDTGGAYENNESDDWCPSDHLPVVVKVTLN